MHLKAVGYTDKGAVRSDNQDSFLVEVLPCSNNKNSLIAIVADGVGGANAGNVASRTAVEVIKNFNLDNDKTPHLALKKAIEAANCEIYEQSQSNKEYQGMATTCSVLVIKGDQAIIGHVGDSRIYRIRNGNIEKLTEDHTLPMRLFKSGEITRTELSDHPQSHILTNALGSSENVEIDITTSLLNENDAYIICSDGLYKYFTDEELMDFVTSTPLDSSPEKLVAMAYERGGSDNITVIVVKVNHNGVSNRTVRIAGDIFPADPVRKGYIKKNIRKIILVAILLIAVIFFILSKLK